MSVANKNTQEIVAKYLEEKQVPQLFDALMAGIMAEKPEDPIAFVQNCLGDLKKNGKSNIATWNQFIKTNQIATSKQQDKKHHLANAIFILGGPGSGKGTQCARMVQDYGVLHVSVGDLLRAEVAAGSDVGKKIDGMMKEGIIVPLEIVLKALKNKLDSLPKDKLVLIDGFPREMEQAIQFEKTIGQVRGAFFFDCSEKVMEQRLLKRGETSGRADDNAETIRKRFHTFQQQSLPVAGYFEKSGRLFRISSEAPVDDVYANVKKSFLSVTADLRK